MSIFFAIKKGKRVVFHAGQKVKIQLEKTPCCRISLHTMPHEIGKLICRHAHVKGKNFAVSTRNNSGRLKAVF